MALLKKIDIFSGNAGESDLVLLLHLFIHEDNVLLLFILAIPLALLNEYYEYLSIKKLVI